MSKFIWITDTYRINIDSIFSLQCISNQNDIIEWTNKYNNFIENLNVYPELPIGNDIYWSPMSGEKISEDEVTRYAEQFEIWAQTQIGQKPIENSRYTIILSTGVKINIPKDKYDEINSFIDKQQKEDS